MTLKKKLWIGILVLTLLTPLGIILPEKFNAEDAWGEWSIEAVEKLVGFVPAKMKETADLWKAPVPDYNLGSEESPGYIGILSYILSAVIGIGLSIAILLPLKKYIVKNE
jgi:cobalt/nickel transport protein